MKRVWLWLLIVLIAAGVWRLRLDVEVLNLLPADAEVVRGLKLYQRNFSNARELIVTLRGADSEETETAARTLAEALRSRSNLVSRVTWQPPWLENPVQSAELIAYLWLNQPPNALRELSTRLAETNLAPLLLQAREQLSTSFSPGELARRGYDPFNLMELPESVRAAAPAMSTGQEMFASADGTFRVLFIEATTDLGSFRQCLVWLEAIRGVVAELRSPDSLPPSVRVGYTGRPAFVAEISGGMERDMIGSVVGTLAIIAGLFWWAHRRWKPLLWLLVLLALILASTMAFGGIIFGALNVVSLGFAAILLGLSVDYGLILYQEARIHQEARAKTQLETTFGAATDLDVVRRGAGSGILWSAVTTAGAFALLNLSSLPGLGQLGSLVAIGVILAAIVMLRLYLPPLLRGSAVHGPVCTSSPRGVPAFAGETPRSTEDATACGTAKFMGRLQAREGPAWILTIAIVAGGGLALAWRGAAFDSSTQALKPRGSEAYAALDEIKTALSQSQEPAWMLVTGDSEAEVATRLAVARRRLTAAVERGTVASFTGPEMLWPNPTFQSANRLTLAELVARRAQLRDAALTHGFAEPSLVVTERILSTWSEALAGTNVYWPSNYASRWVLEKVTARRSAERGFRPAEHQGWLTRHEPSPAQGAEAAEFMALILIYPKADNIDSAGLGLHRPEDNPSGAANDDRHFVVSGWQLLGVDMFDLVRRDLTWVLGPMVGLLLLGLWMAFRRVGEVLISLGCLLVSGFLLSAVMALAGWSWNLMNLMALPLLLGSGVDYSIHMQLALRRHAGDLGAVWRSVGRALMLCAGTTVAGFGSLSLSANAGMASLGQVCSAGIACAFIVTLGLLPAWWSAAHKKH